MKIAEIKKAMKNVTADYSALDHMVSGLVIAYGAGIDGEVEKLEENPMTEKEFEALSERGLVKGISNLRKSLDGLKVAVASTYHANITEAIPPKGKEG